MKSLPIAVISGLAVVTTTFTGCDTMVGQGAGTGAAAGAIIGGIAGNNVRSAAIGAGAGALAGAVVGKMVADERRANYEGGPVAYGEVYRVATPSRYWGYVISPYRPHAMVDVRGIRSGVRVVDPVSGHVFINP